LVSRENNGDTNFGKDRYTCERACHQRVHDETLKYILELWQERNVLSLAFENGDAKSWTKRVNLLKENLRVRDGTYRGGTRRDQNMLARLREAWVDELKFG
jgi:hypothetical protein